MNCGAQIFNSNNNAGTLVMRVPALR